MAGMAVLAFLPLRVVALAFAALFLWRAYLHGPFTIGGPAWALVAVILLTAALTRLHRDALLGIVYIAAFLAFVRLRMFADETSFAVQYTYPITADGVFGGIPSVWLQAQLYDPGRMSPFDLAMGTIYLSHFVALHAVGLFLLVQRSPLLPRLVGAFGLMLAVALATHVVLPTAPPWLASEDGYIGADVHRIIAELTARIDDTTYEQAARAVDNNLVAAMPSLHAGFAVLVAIVLAQYGRKWAIFGAAYVGAMCLAFTYTGEHYVVDSIVGIGLAYMSWWLIPKMSRITMGLREAAHRPRVKFGDSGILERRESNFRHEP